MLYAYTLDVKWRELLRPTCLINDKHHPLTSFAFFVPLQIDSIPSSICIGLWIRDRKHGKVIRYGEDIYWLSSWQHPAFRHFPLPRPLNKSVAHLLLIAYSLCDNNDKCVFHLFVECPISQIIHHKSTVIIVINIDVFNITHWSDCPCSPMESSIKAKSLFSLCNSKCKFYDLDIFKFSS